MLRALKVVGWSIVQLVAAVLLIVAALIVHLPTHNGRTAVAEIARQFLGAVPGHLVFDRIEQLDHREIRITGVGWSDVQYQPLLRGGTLVVRPAWQLVFGLLKGAPMPAIELTAPRAWARVPLLPTDPPSTQPEEPSTLRLHFPSVRVRVAYVESALEGIEGNVQGLDLAASASVLPEGIILGVDRLAARVWHPQIGEEVLGLRGRFDQTHANSGNVDLQVTGPTVRCHIVANNDRNGNLTATIAPCVVPPGVLDRLLARPPESSIPGEMAVVRADITGRIEGPWDLRAQLSAAGERIDLHGAGDLNRQTLELMPRGVRLQAIASWLPVSHLDGRIVATRAVQGEAQDFTLNASEFRGEVMEYPVPPLRAQARMEGQRIDLRELVIPDLQLTANGMVDLGQPELAFRGQVDVNSPELSRIPWVRDRLAGRIELHAEGESANGIMRAEVRAQAANLRAPQARLLSANLRAQVRGRDPLGDLQANAHITGLRVTGVGGPFDVRLSAAGDARHTVTATADVSGAGVVAFLPPTQTPTNGPTYVRVTASANLADEGRLVVAIRQAEVSARGARAILRGNIGIARGDNAPSGLRGINGNVAIRTPEHGALQANITRGRIDLQAEHFDLRWLTPIIGDRGIAGILDGTANVDPDRPTYSTVDLRLANATVGGVREVAGRVQLARDGNGPMRVGVQVTVPRGFAQTNNRLSTANVEVVARPPRRIESVEGWFGGVERIAFTLDNVDLATFDDLLPPGMIAQGSVQARANIARTAQGGPLEGSFVVEVQNATGGLDVGLMGRRRMVPATVPLHLRAAFCTSLTSTDTRTLPLTFGLAVGAQRNDETRGMPENCQTTNALLTHPLVATYGTLNGPWQTSIQALLTEFQAGRREPTPATQTLLRATDVDLTVAMGPVRRNDWPLRTLPVRNRDGQLQTLQPPNVPEEAEVDATIHARGQLLGLATELDVHTRVPPMPEQGFDEPVEAMIHGRLAPSQGGSLLGPVQFTLGLLGTVSPQAAREAQGRIEADVQVNGVAHEIMTRGVDAVDIRRFDINSDNIRVERLAWARQRGLRGAVALEASATQDPRERVRVRVRVNIAGLQSRIIDGAGRTQATPALNAISRVVLLHEGDNWSSKLCLLGSIRSASLDCNPLNPAAPGPGNLGVAVTMPLRAPQGNAISSLRPDLDHALANVRAESFDLATVAPFAPEDVVTGLAGQLSAGINWDGQTPDVVEGQVTLANGRMTLPSIGEPIHHMNINVQSRNREVRIDNGTLSLGRGSLRFNANATVGGQPGLLARLNFTGTADDLAIAAAGNTWGWLDGRINLQATARRDGATASLDLSGARVLVQEQSTRDLQPIEDDPDVFIAGRTQLAAPRVGGAFPIDISFNLPTPIWLRRSDFALAARGRGQIHNDAAGSAISGTIELASTQTWFSIFGKRFDFDRLRVTFDGNVSFNPELDIAAHYDSPSAGRIHLSVMGRFSNPAILFRAEQFPTASQSEILSLIVIGRRSSQASNGQSDLASQATAAIGSLITGLTLGTVTSSLSRNFSFLPTLIVEPGSGSTRGRYGAGVNLSPRIYLQATYGAATAGVGQATASVAADEFRLLLEYAITETFTGSASWGTMQQTNRWGVDVFWSP